MNRGQKLAVAVILAMGFVPLCFVISERSKLYIEIENASGSPVTDVNVKFNGGVVNLPTLGKGDEARRPIHVQSESALSVSFSDAKGQSHETNLNVYLEPSYRGAIRLKIDADQRVEMTNEVRIY